MLFQDQRVAEDGSYKRSDEKLKEPLAYVIGIRDIERLEIGMRTEQIPRLHEEEQAKEERQAEGRHEHFHEPQYLQFRHLFLPLARNRYREESKEHQGDQGGEKASPEHLLAHFRDEIVEDGVRGRKQRREEKSARRA